MGILSTLWNAISNAGSAWQETQKTMYTAPATTTPTVTTPTVETNYSASRGGGFATGTTGSGQSSANKTNIPVNNVIGDTSAGAGLANLNAALSAQTANAITDKWLSQQMEYQTQSAEKAMQFSAEEAQKNRDWQEKMSNTAYQRAIADLKAAGLNPILAYTQGGATTPSGSSASGIAMSGGSSSAAQAQTFKGNEIEDIFNIVANTAMGAMSIISRLK